MRHLSTFIRVLGVSFSLLTAPAIFANTTVSAKEADALIKDDIANNSRAAVSAKTIDCHPDTQQREVRDLKIVF